MQPEAAGKEPSPHAQPTRAALPRPREMFGEGEKKKSQQQPLASPRGRARGTAAAPGAGPALCCPAHPTPRAAAPGAVGFGRQQPLRNAERSHLAHSCFVHGGWALPRPPPHPAGAEGSKHCTHTPPPRIQPHQAGSQQPPAQSFIEVFAQNKHQGHGAGCSTRQPAPGVPGGGGGAGLGGAPQLFSKQPRWCHCWSRTRRTDWIRGWLASHSFQCRYSPFSKTCWRPRYPGYS